MMEEPSSGRSRSSHRRAHTLGQPLEPEPSSLLHLVVPPRSCGSALSPPLLLRCFSPPRPLPWRAPGQRPPSPRFPQASSPLRVPESLQGVCPQPKCPPG
ncbi:hypothetical protein HispidOSU_018867 [Sigmodon hispidus]